MRRSVLNEVLGRRVRTAIEMKVAQLQNTETTTTTTTPHCRWAWSQDCIDTPMFYSEFSPRHPPCFLNSPLFALLAAGSALGDPRGENTLLSPGSQGDCWRIPVYDFAAALAAPGGWGGQALSQEGRGEMNEKSAEENMFLLFQSNKLKIPKTVQQATNFFPECFCFWKYGHNK